MDKSYKPLVSIITPSYNQGQFLEDCILSIKNQDYDNIEHIIIDGASPDNTIDVIKMYEGTYNLKWLSERDNGQADAIKKGFKLAKGDIIAWLNCDDYYLHSKVIGDIVKYFDLYKDADIISGGGYFVNKQGQFIALIDVERKYINANMMRYADFILQPSTFKKRKVIDAVEVNENYTYVFDWLFFLNILESGFNILAISDIISAYRVYGDNKTAQDNSKRKKEIAFIVKRNLGKFHPQSLYCHFIYFVYLFAESLPATLGNGLKKFAVVFNVIISKLTNKRLYSS